MSPAIDYRGRAVTEGGGPRPAAPGGQPEPSPAATVDDDAGAPANCIS